MTAEEALKGMFSAALGGTLGWIASECAKETIRDRKITPKAADSILMLGGLVGWYFARGYWKFFLGGVAAIGFGRLLIQFESGELESEGEQCPLKLIGSLWRWVLLPGPP